MKEKLKYSPADVDIICFGSHDVIATSSVEGPFTEGKYESDGWV